ncbi:MAG: hypothetical protein FWC28_03450 [Proteobacteria bacterium]|nr:hypothetical protein [Cystobacterineae bacterium]MCL2259162.1 hypothetical protein [Cystobacterineae bacterium]MCL2314295.1 hypothetical protein [Pseudomonadota bacterium]
MTIKRGEQGRFEVVFGNESLQGAQEAVANEVAAAEPEMPPLVAEPPLRPKRGVTIIKFERQHKPRPVLPLVHSPELAAQEEAKRLLPPIFGGAARMFSVASRDAQADPPPPWPSQDAQASNADTETLYEEGLGENTPNLYVVSEPYLEEAAEAPPPKPPEAKALPARARRAPKSWQTSQWFVWSIAVALSAGVVAWVWFMQKEQQKRRRDIVVQLEGQLKEQQEPPSVHAQLVEQKAPTVQAKRLPLTPSPSEHSGPNASLEVHPPTPTPKTQVAQTVSPAEKTNGALKAIGRPKPEPIPSDERISAGLDAARKHVQKDKFELALVELNKIEPLFKKYPARPLEFDFLYGVSLAFTSENARQTLAALRLLDALRDSYKTNPDYWRAAGFAHQVLGMNETRPSAARCKHLQAAKLAYAETMRFGKNNRKYTQAHSYIEHIERDFQGLGCADAGN